MRELSLFTGAGGGILGSKLLGWKTVGYVEWNNYCQRVIAQQIKDGILDNAPIFSDIRAFVDQGYAARYRGLANIISAGFPCQPHSIAGKRLGGADDRDKWPETRECIRIIQPDFAWLENVTGLLSAVSDRGAYIGRVLGELSEIGYNARWCVLPASKLGAPHKRERVWIFAYTRCKRQEGANQNIRSIPQVSKLSEPFNFRCALSNATSQGLEGKVSTRRIRQYNRLSPQCSWWATEPELGSVANGVANRVDRLKAIGNGQVPAVVRAAWEILSEGLI